MSQIQLGAFTCILLFIATLLKRVITDEKTEAKRLVYLSLRHCLYRADLTLSIMLSNSKATEKIYHLQI